VRQRWRAATYMVIGCSAALAACSMGDAAPGAGNSRAPTTAATSATVATARTPQTDPPATTVNPTVVAAPTSAPPTAAATPAPTAPPTVPATAPASAPPETPPTTPPVIESIEGCAMAPTPPFVGAIPMKRLDHNDRVRELQQMLTTLGFNIGSSGLDGHFGPDTEDAFEQWQSQQGAPVTGVVCMEDWYAMVNATGGDGTGTG
jgi:peptidoglycan hydrolase-like protein with peptidoglycan-binding domain